MRIYACYLLPICRLQLIDFLVFILDGKKISNPSYDKRNFSNSRGQGAAHGQERRAHSSVTRASL